MMMGMIWIAMRRVFMMWISTQNIRLAPPHPFFVERTARQLFLIKNWIFIIFLPAVRELFFQLLRKMSPRHWPCTQCHVLSAVAVFKVLSQRQFRAVNDNIGNRVVRFEQQVAYPALMLPPVKVSMTIFFFQPLHQREFLSYHATTEYSARCLFHDRNWR
jgi:hypothetical protein